MNIIEVELLSDDLTETVKFYRRVLGLGTYQSGQDLITFQIGFSKLIFRKSNNVKPVYHFAIDIPINRFAAAHDFIKKHVPILPVGHNNDIADFTNWDAKSFYFNDNNGNIVEFITRYPNKAYFHETFTSKAYISISEIGLVTNNVAELADTLFKDFGVPIYHRQPRGDTFTVAGDDEGLFIIGSKGRQWYPTSARSLSYRTRVLFLNKGNIGHIIR